MIYAETFRVVGGNEPTTQNSEISPLWLDSGGSVNRGHYTVFRMSLFLSPGRHHSCDTNDSEPQFHQLGGIMDLYNVIIVGLPIAVSISNSKALFKTAMELETNTSIARSPSPSPWFRSHFQNSSDLLKSKQFRFPSQTMRWRRRPTGRLWGRCAPPPV